MANNNIPSRVEGEIEDIVFLGNVARSPVKGAQQDVQVIQMFEKEVEAWSAEEGVTFACSLRDAIRSVEEVESALRLGLMPVSDMMEVELPGVLDAFVAVGFPKSREAHREVVFRVRVGDFDRARLEILGVFVYMTGLN